MGFPSHPCEWFGIVAICCSAVRCYASGDGTVAIVLIKVKTKVLLPNCNTL